MTVETLATGEPPATDINYSQVREDPRLELHVVEELAQRRQRPLRLLMVGSGGCTALSALTSPAVASIDAVDLNPAQVHLIELRRAALATLAIDEQLVLIGERAEDEDGQRLELYAAVREAIPERSRAFWDQHPEAIGYGVNRVGRFDRMVEEVAQAFDAAGIDALHQPARALGHDRWAEIFHRVFENGRLKELLGTAMTGYSATRSFAQHFSQAFAYALRRFASEDNYFLHQVFARQYSEKTDDRPPYLVEKHQAVIHEHGTDRLQVHTGNFAGKMVELAATGGRYDLIQTSDITDWMPVREAHKLLRSSRECLDEGGCVLSRRLNADHSLMSLMGTHLAVDTAMSSTLRELDRSFLYSEVVVGFRPAA